MESINYNIPITITENFEGGEECVIEGIAINSTTTDNNHKFLPEELRKSALTLKNRPLLTDHEEKLSSIAGRVVEAKFDESNSAVRFRAKINDTPQGKLAKQLIKNGDLTTVSIGANVTSFEEDDGSMIPRGIKFKELSLVATPADDMATFNIIHSDFLSALKEVYNKKTNEMMHCPECDKVFSNKEELDKHMKSNHKDKMSNSSDNLGDNKLNLNGRKNIMEKDAETTETQSISMKEDTKEFENLKLEVSNLKNFISEVTNQTKAQSNLLSQVLSEFKTLKEATSKVEETPKVETKKEEAVKINESKKLPIKVEAEVEEVEDTVNEKTGYKIAQGYKSFTVVRNNYTC